MIPKKLSEIIFGIMSPDEIIKMSVVAINSAELYSSEGNPMKGGPLDPRLGPATNEPCMTCSLKRRQGRYGCVGHFGFIELAMPIYHLAFIKWIQKVLNAICEKCGRLTLLKEDREKFWKRMRRLMNLFGHPRIELAKKVLDKASQAKICPYCGHKKQAPFRFDNQLMTFIRLIEISPDEVKKYEERNARIIKKVRGGKLRYYYQRKYEPEEIREILASIYSQYEHLENEESAERRKDLILMGFHPDRSRPEWTILTVFPVPPLTIRPPAIPSSGERQEDQLTLVLRDLIRENNKLKDKLEGGPRKVMEQYWLRIQHLIEIFFGLKKRSRVRKEPKGIFHRLHGKEGIFRKYLSGKRVDYSARAVISPDPYISVDEVGVPEKVARNFLIAEVANRYNIDTLRELVRRGPWRYPGAVYIHKRNPDGTFHKIMLEPLSSDLLEKHANDLQPGDIVERHLMNGDIVVFNRQPTLHRISMMGHYARILPHNTFRINLLTCTPYNADFDGDEMNLHLARFYETRAELSILMEVKKHIITPRYGGPIIGPKQDYITSAFLLTKPGTYLTKDEVCQMLYYVGITDIIPPTIVKDGVEYWSGRDVFSTIIPRGIFYKGKIKGLPLGIRDKSLRIRIWDGKIIDGFIDKNSIGAEKPENLIQKIVEKYGYDVAKEFLNKLSAMLIRHITDRGFSITLWDVYVPQELRKKIKKVLDNYIKKANELVQKYLRGELEPEAGLDERETLEDKLIELFERARGEAGNEIVKHMPTRSQFMVMTLTGARGGDLNIQQVLATVGLAQVRGKRLSRGYIDRTLSHFKKGDIGPMAGGFVVRNFVEGLDPLEYFFHNASGRDSLVDTAIRTADSGYFYRRLVNALQDIRVEYDGSARTVDGKIIQFRYGGDCIHTGKSYHGKLTDMETILEEMINERAKNKIPGIPKTKWPSYYDEIIERVKKNISKATADDLKSVLKKFYDANIMFRKEELLKLYDIIYEKYLNSMVDPGESIGVVASQSLSEPATQLTLRTFHWAGAVAITRGLPRLKEIFDAVRKLKRPMIRAYLEKAYRHNEKRAKKVLNEIKGIRLEDVVESITLDPEGRQIVVEVDVSKLKKLGIKFGDIVEKLESSKKINVETEGKYIYISLVEEQKKSRSTRRMSLGELYMKIRGFVIKGIADYWDAKLGREEVDKEKGIYEYYINIAANDISYLLYQEGIDLSRLETNNIREFARIYGIEAARLLAIKETIAVLDDYSLDVDTRHITLAVDTQMWSGKVVAIGRYGLIRAKPSVIARAAFEEVKKHIVAAAICGEVDHITGISESVVTGQQIPVGTGMVRILYGVPSQLKERESSSSE